jgi:excisionase family DNA binding protein
MNMTPMPVNNTVAPSQNIAMEHCPTFVGRDFGRASRQAPHHTMVTPNVSQLEVDSTVRETNAVRLAPNLVEGRGAVEALRVAPHERGEGSSACSRAKERRIVAANVNCAVPALEKLLTFSGAAEILGISLRHFRRLVDSGKLAFVKVSERSPRVRRSELERFLEASAVKYSEV